ncbi:hypothetical protein DXG03_002206 [Asterophora parasitica]|uniref:SAM domain-containing protein n=1 Tax=Asterophora parasitica TaxID=117018 RepID=A0A9P7KEV2_9AGAR|nr:hypothetical protein DXG03_002206 [Asterophora parasitica]
MSTSAEIVKAAPPSAAELAPASLPNGGQGADSSTLQGLDLWLENFRKYEATLQEVIKTSGETKFKAELSTIETCEQIGLSTPIPDTDSKIKGFKVLPDAERTAAVYTLMLHSNQDQIRFFISVLQQMIRPEVAKIPAPVDDAGVKPKSGRSVRPPSLNLPELGSPTTPTPITSNEPPPFAQADPDQQDSLKLNTTSLSQNNVPDAQDPENAAGPGAVGLPGLGALSPFHLNMLANAGLSAEAQLLAAQLIMSGVVQPVAVPTPHRGKKPSHLGDAKTWRTPTSAKYPGSALRSSGLRTTALKGAALKSAGLQSAGLKSSGLDSASSMATPREEDFDPEMLNDIPAWLRSLRLHKYTSCFDGLTWQEMIVLDDAILEAKGVAALGARRRLLRTFEHARKRMGMEGPGSDSATPTTSSAFPNAPFSSTDDLVPHSAAPPSKLSIASPIFVPSFERGPQSAAPAVSITVGSPTT